MALKLYYKITHNGIYLENGRCYKFKYANFENDPYPHVFFLYAIRGTNPSTGHMWNLIQCVNLNYLPRAHRRAFVREWKDVLVRSKTDFKLAWRLVSLKFPYMKIAVRRYFLSPSNYIQRLEYIPPEKMEEEIIRNMGRDYSLASLRARGKIYRQTHPKRR